MLPFDRKPWAKRLAATVIAITLIAAICVPVILHARKELDPPIVLTIVLLLLAIIPPNVVVLRRRTSDADRRKSALVSQTAGNRA